MASKATLNIFPAETCLIDKLVASLIDRNERDFSKTAVILPTQRLGTHLLARLARHLGAFRPPKVWTLESLLLLSRKEDSHLPISDAAADFMIQNILKDGTFQQLRPGHEREIRLIMGEMYENCVEESAFKDAIDSLDKDVYHDSQHVDGLFVRLSECLSVIKSFQEHILQSNFVIKQRFMAELCKDNNLDLLLSPFETIYLIGYTSIAPSWRTAVLRMCKNPNVKVWLSEKPDIYHKTSPLEGLLDFFKRACNPVNIVATSPKEKQTIQLVEVDTPFSEIACTHKLVRDLIESAHEPSQIGILVTNEGVYESICSSLSKSVFEDANIAMTRAFRNTDVGRWLEKVLLVVERGELSHWVDWLLDPYTCTWLESEHEVDIKTLVWNLSRSHSVSLDHFLAGSEESERFLETIKSISRAFASGSKPMAYWAETTLSWINRCFTQLMESQGDPTRDVIEQFQRITEQIAQLSDRLISRGDYFEFMSTHLLGADIRSIGEPLSGIQVISLAESRYYPFSTVIILGCNEGTFPKALPKDELFDNYIKKQMGLPGWEVLEAMEDQTFHLLKARLPQIFMLRSKTVDQQATVRSRFIEKLHSENLIKFHKMSLSPEHFWSERQRSSIEPVATLETEGHYPKEVNALWQNVSASSLEKLVRCPYRYLLSKLGVQSMEFSRIDDPRSEGEWLHSVLESFFTGKLKDEILFTWCEDDWESFETLGLERLNRLTITLGPKNIDRKPLYFQLLQQSWPAFITHIKTFYQDSFFTLSKGMREAKIGKSSQHNGITIRGIKRNISGSIDSLDRSQGITMLTDYKRKTLPTKKDVQHGLSPQLAFYALAVKNFMPDISVDQLILGYWNIIKGEWQSHGVGKFAKESAIKRRLASSRSDDIESLVEGTLKAWCWREGDIEEKKRFYADPSACGLCNYSDLCRKDDPRFRQRIQEQDFFTKFIEENP